jgi:hypothetical protein
MRSSRVIFGAWVLLFVSVAAQSASTPAFTASGKNCSDITWQADVLARYPNVAKSCQSVVERNGKTFVMFKGTVQRRAGYRGLYIRFEGGDRAILVNPPADLVARIGNQTLKVRESLPGQELTVFVPSDRFVASFGDETAVETDVVIDEVRPVAEVETLTDEPPPASAPSTQAPAPTPPAAMPAATPAPTVTPTPVASQTNEKILAHRCEYRTDHHRSDDRGRAQAFLTELS